ncbi:MAG: acetyl-CoA carboxylase, carboxyltransferase subunit beta [Bacillota bacterium]
MLKDFFRAKPRYVVVKSPPQEAVKETKQLPEPGEKKEIQEGLWIKCQNCDQIIYHKDLSRNLRVCPKCGFHFRVSARERLQQVLDENSFKEIFAGIRSLNPLNFPDYENKIKKSQKATGMTEGIITGLGKIEAIPVAIGSIDFSFIGGSMGSVVGEKVTRLIEFACDKRLPLIIITAGGGGARMHEGIFSLMQMAKTCQALVHLSEARSPYFSVLTDPTMGGIFASFATLGDVNIAEPGAMIGFSGPRVIKNTIGQTLPPDFQTSEFQLSHGMIDMIVERKDLRKTLHQLLELHRCEV